MKCFILLLLFLTVFTCDPDEFPYWLTIIYSDDAASQSVTVYDAKTGICEYDFNGYGKDNTVSSNQICLKSSLYTIVARDGLRDSWSDNSFFILTTIDSFEILRGTCDSAGEREFSIFPSMVVPSKSTWLFHDGILEDSWYLPSYNDSDWQKELYGSFPPFADNRYYRLKTSLSCEALKQSSTIMFALHGQNYSSLYLNGKQVYRSLNTYVPSTESNGFFLYSISLSRIIRSCSGSTVSFTIAVRTSSLITEMKPDDYDLAVYLISDGSSRTVDCCITSRHWKDFFSNPLEFATDSDRFTYWRVKGQYGDFTLTFNSHHYEYVNAYQITSGTYPNTYPTSWIVKGCIKGENDIWSCDILDQRSNIHWDGPITMREYSMNTLQKSYQRYVLDLRTSDANSELWINEITFLSRAENPPASLQYPSSLLSIYVNLDDVFLEASSGFTEFSVDPDLPPGLKLDPVSGLVWGCAMEMTDMEYTITAKHAITGDDASTLLTIRASMCAYPNRIVDIEWVSYQQSVFEEWRLLNHQQEVIASDHGQECGPYTVSKVRHLCLAPDLYTLQQRVVNRKTNQHGGHITMHVWVSTSYNDGSFPLSLFSQSYQGCTEEWSVGTRLSDCSAQTVSLSYLLDRDAWWRSTEDHVPPSWADPNYDDSRWDFLPLSNLYAACRIRGQFIVSDISRLEAVDIVFTNALRFSVYVNGHSFGEVSIEYVQVTHSMRVAADMLKEGVNTLAVRVSRQLWDKRFVPLVIIIQPIYTSTPYWNPGENELTASHTCWGYSVASLMDGNVNSDWKGEYRNGEVSVRASFPPIMSQMIRGYCLTSSSASALFDPEQWHVRIRSLDMRWTRVSTMTQIRFSSRSQRRCFPLFLPSLGYVASGMEIVFTGEATPNAVQLSELSILTYSFTQSPLPPLSYGTPTVDVVTDVMFPALVLPSPLYTNFILLSPLPNGLYLDSADGHIWGKVSESFDTVVVEIGAESYQDKARTTLTLMSKSCESPFSLVTIQLNGLEDLSFFLSFVIVDAEQNVVASEFVPPSASPKATTFTYCLRSEDYQLRFTDKSNAGFLRATFSILSDGILLHTGFFNAGFSNHVIDFFAGSLLSPVSTLWYYQMDDTEPPSRWYASIDPVHELWEVATPGSFPQPQGRAQYFKTVMDVSSILSSLRKYSAYVIEIRVRGGAIVYVNGNEVLRHQMPDGRVTKDTLPLSSFPEPSLVTASVSIQFNPFTKDVVVIAAELHDLAVQSLSTFQIGVRLLPDGSICNLHGKITVNKPDSSVIHREQLMDGKYYNKMVINDSCEDIEVVLDTNHREYHYVTEICLFTANTAGEYPHTLALEGGVQTDHTMWTPLYSTEVDFQRVAYGQYACFRLFNEQSFSLFRLHFADCEHKNQLEIAEMEFYSNRLDGFCEDEARNRTPSGEWKDMGCADLYIGKYLRFCENGTWSQTINHCMPKSPIAFKYKASVFYVTRRDMIELTPSVVGAEIVFDASLIPQGLFFDNDTGTFVGVYTGEDLRVNVTVTARNIGGCQSTTFSLVVVNDNEELIVTVAFLAAACLIGAVVYISVLLSTSNSETVKKAAEKSHLHTKQLPEKMLPLLV